MIRSPSTATWERVLAQALKGDSQHLVELLTVPVRTDSAGQPLPDDDGQAFYPLPDDLGLRQRIVRTLMLLGESRRKPGRPGASDNDVQLAKLWLLSTQPVPSPGRRRQSAPDYDTAAALIGIDRETLIDRLRKLKRTEKSRTKPGG